MPYPDDWIVTRVAEAHQGQPLITAAVAERFTEMLLVV